MARIDVMVVQSRAHPLIGAPATVRDLAASPWILNSEGCAYRAALQRAVQGSGGQIRISVATHGTRLQLGLVAAGLGLGLAPHCLVQTSEFASQLAVLPVPDFTLSVDAWLLSAPEMGNLQGAVAMLAQYMRSCLAMREARA